MRVLLVDDELELVSTLAERLGYRGIEADWVENAEKAIEKVGKCPYDVAVLDVKLPKISGIELKRILQEKAPDLKFLFMTGHGSERDFQEGAAEAGEQFYLVKPVDITVLMEKMKEVLAG